MLDIFATYATDENLENNGAWFPLGSKDKDGIQPRLLIARANNRRYNKALTAEVEQNRSTLDLEDDAAEALQEQIAINVMSSTLLLGWEYIGFKGEEKPYSVAAARELLSVKDFRRLVGRLADQMEAFKFKEEKQQGNA
jgi:phytoene/squalene synthetase